MNFALYLEEQCVIRRVFSQPCCSPQPSLCAAPVSFIAQLGNFEAPPTGSLGTGWPWGNGAIAEAIAGYPPTWT